MPRLTVTALEERLYEYTQTHSEEHVEDAKRLDLILENLQHHTQNAHGLGSKIKQLGGLSAISAVILAALEVIRQFFL